MINGMLAKATEMHKAGQFAVASKLYEAVLNLQSDHADANHNMGLLKLDMGDDLDALPYLQAALRADTTIAQFWLSYIKVLIKLERLNDASRVLDLAFESGFESEEFLELQGQFDAPPNGSKVSQIPATALNKSESNILDTKKIDQAFTLAKKKVKEGASEEAKRIYQDILDKFPKNKKAQQGIATFKNPPKEVINQLLELYERGLLSGVVQTAQLHIQKHPEAFSLWNILGTGLKDLGRVFEASQAFKRVTVLNPKFADGFNNLGISLKLQGKLDEAVEAYTKAVFIEPHFLKAHNNMGATLLEQGKLEQAIEAFKNALKVKPDQASPYNNMGVALTEQGKLDNAIEVYNKALAIKPDYPEAYNNMGNALKEQEKLDKAIEFFTKALSLKPNYTDAWLNGAEALEQWNKLKQLEQWLENAFETFETVPADLEFLKAKLLWRKKDFEEASVLIFGIDLNHISKIRKQDFLHLKAKCYEKSKKFDQAYACFSKSNELAKETNDYVRSTPEIYFQTLINQHTKIRTDPVKIITHHPTQKTDFTPVFLVGFPRSGTTLLDTILRSHSRIEVVEERPSVEVARAFLENKVYDDIARNPLSPELISGAKTVYETEFMKHFKGCFSDSVFIDKFPLNLLQVPLIQQLYPQAKFILALRHPLDTILSCWMQNFKLNPAMANMVDLDRIVEFYCLAMDTFKICRTKYSLSVHELRYENLLEDLSGEVSSLLNFLELNWEDQMENYQETALKRGRIYTPSYSQVVQPIYKDAKYRWLNYDKQLKQYLAKVECWIYEFGYNKH